MKNFDIVIIGAGPAGLYAHYYASLKGFKSCLLEANSEMGGQPSILFPAKAIHDYPGYSEISGSQLMNNFINQIEDKSNIFLNTVVSDIKSNNNGFEVITSCESYNAKYVIIATGGGFFKFNKINGVECCNTHYCVKQLDLYKDKRVVVAGGGDAAIDWVIELDKRCLPSCLSLVHRRDQFRANGSKVESLKNRKVNILLNKTSSVIAPGKLELVDNVTNKKEILEYDYLIVQYGQSYSLQDNSLLKNFNLDKLNRIIVDSNGNTNIPNIYAIGNVASFNDKPRLISIAVTDALKAIEDIAKKVAKYDQK